MKTLTGILVAVMTLTWSSAAFSGEIHEAIRRGDVEKVKALLEAKPELIEKGDIFGTPLHAAVRWAKAEIVELLLEHKADINADAGSRGMPLHMAVSRAEILFYGDSIARFGVSHGWPAMTPDDAEKMVRLLIAKGADLNARISDNKFSPLDVAMMIYPNGKIIELLLAAGADVNAKNPSGSTALHRAVAGDAWDPHLVKLLLAYNAEVNVKNNDGNTPLHLACLRWDKADLVKLLLENGAQVNATNDLGETPLHLVARAGFDRAMHILLSKGALVEAKAKNGATPICEAIRGGHKSAIKLLLSQKADLNVKGADSKPLLPELAGRKFETVSELLLVGKSGAEKKKLANELLHWAARLGHKDEVDYLIRQKVNVNELLDGRTALEAAVWSDNVSLVKALLDAGANILLTNQHGYTALYGTRSAEVAELLISRGMPVNTKVKPHNTTPLYRAAENGCLGVVKVLIKHKADLDARGEKGTPLEAAIEKGHTDVARLLIASRANVNMFDALVLAVQKDNFEIVQTLLSRKIDFAVYSTGRLLPLQQAVVNGNLTIVKALLDAGHPIDGTSVHGWTALHHAAQLGNKPITEYLLSRGASIAVEDEKGRTPLHLAAIEGHADLCKLLLDNGSPLDIFSAIALGKPREVEKMLKANPKLVESEREIGTPLIWAIRADRENLVEMLLKNGANVEAMAKWDGGMTALTFACYLGHEGAVEVLLANKANVNVVTDYEKRTPLRLAVSNHSLKITEMLLSHGADKELHQSYQVGVMQLLDYRKPRYKEMVELLKKYQKEKPPANQP